MRVALTMFALGLPGVTLAAPPDANGLEFYEKKIRPALTEHCYRCHSADAEAKNKLRGGLKLDTRAAVNAGGDSGPALDSAKPAASLLLKSIRSETDSPMPPVGKLPPEVIADFEKWVAMGAPDPRDGGATAKRLGMSLEDGKQFWAYVPPKSPLMPVVKDAAWPVNDIDRFVLAKIEAAKLTPNRDAERMTLARRVAYDLTGMPLTPAEVDAFVADVSPDAYEKLVDRLIVSPAFGERWGRHWLDVARYAESVTLRGLVFKEAWRYRDYIIDNFNRDVPFDRFVREQLAGDLLPAPTPADRQRNLVATAYLMLGNTNLEDQDKKQLRMDVVDEQLDVITKGLLAQTVTCARCHDHKFDPIPTKDYYALAGILRNVKSLEDANVSAWTEVPLPADPATESALAQKNARVATLKEAIRVAKAASAKRLAAKGGPSGVLAPSNVPGIVVDDAQAKKVGVWQLSTHSKTYVGKGYVHDQDAGKGQKSITFTPSLPADGRYEVRLAYIAGSSRSKSVPVTLFGPDGETVTRIDMTQNPPIGGRFVSLGTHRFEKAGQGFVIVSNEGTKGHVTADCVTFIPEGSAPLATSKAEPASAGSLAKLEAELKAVQKAWPRRAMAMAPIELPKIEETFVHVRGSVHTLGEPAPRGVLRVAATGPVSFPKDQSGRVQLADWIVSPENPLTARVIVNRTWHWLFGSGLVQSVDNFGTTGELPSHPELLDYLATKFVRDGWSMKKLVRELVLSRTYCQSSALAADSPTRAADPENRLFAKANRKRLEAEEIRDSVLIVAGTLDPARGGPGFPDTLSADYGFTTTSLRRSVYLPLFRNAIPEFLDAFDAADVSVVAGKRNTSTVAPQALYLLNSPFVIEQAKHAAARLLAEPAPSIEARVSRAYRLTLGREPTPSERATAAKFVAHHDAEAWAALMHGLMASGDFRYVD